MEIYYNGTCKEVTKQQKCKHSWRGPHEDRAGIYNQCTLCQCIQRLSPEEAAQVDKKQSLHNICGAFVQSVDLDFDYNKGGGVVTLHFHKAGKARDYWYPGMVTPKCDKPVHTEVSFPFDVLTVRSYTRE